MIPARRLLLAGALLLALALAASFESALEPMWRAAAILVLLVMLGDAAAVLAARMPAASRSAPATFPLGLWHRISLRVTNPAARARGVEIFDHTPDAFEVRGIPRRVTVPAGGWADVRYEARPVERGLHRFGRAEARIDSPLGLWQRRARLAEEGQSRVYPNFAALTRYALLATDHRLSQIGILQRRRRGQGLEFHQLREYREGDAQRQIDWKATARSERLVSREYQDERDQQVMLVIDCGRRLAARDGELAHFDHVLNAALLLAYVSLRQGDAVGFLTMSGEPRFMAPRKGAAVVTAMLNQLYDLQPSLMTSDYEAAALELQRRVRKRALVVMLSNLRDEDDDAIAPALRLLARHHLVLFASLREAILSRALSTRVDTFERALTHAAAADYLRERALALTRLERAGILCLDVEPQDLPTALVNRYLDIKREGRL
jgi:uncharacterized protein (DUF58 family)